MLYICLTNHLTLKPVDLHIVISGIDKAMTSSHDSVFRRLKPHAKPLHSGTRDRNSDKLRDQVWLLKATFWHCGIITAQL